MKNKLLYINLLNIISLFASCVKEDNMQLPSGSDATLSLNFPTRSAGYGEYEVTDVRIVSFIPESATTAPGVLDVNGGKRELNPYGNILQTLRTGVRDVYVFTNEPEDIGRELEAMKSLTDLARIKIPYTAGTLTPPFFGYHVENREIKSGENPVMDANALRTVSKVELIITYTWGPTTNLHEELVMESVQVKNLPKHSYLIGRPYDLVGDYIDSEIITGFPLDNRTTIPNTYRSRPLSIYIPEFLGASADNGKHAYIEIIGHLANDPTISCTYTIPLGDGMVSTPMTDYNITRNTEYQIVATIESYGQTNNIGITANVVDWNEVESPSEVGDYLRFSDGRHANWAILTDYDTVSVRGEEIEMYCRSNTGRGCTAYLYDKDGVKLGTHVAKSEAPHGVQAVKLTIPPLSSSLDHNEYTVEIHDPNPAVKPVKLHFIQAEGLILNADLLKNIGGGFVPPATFPAGKYGIQVAKIGNVLPRADVAALSIDPFLNWSNDLIFTGVTDPFGWDGKEDTEALLALGPEKYPAANNCRNLGPEWYLPARNVFSRSIAENQGCLTAPFKLYLKGYRVFYSTSSESDERTITVIENKLGDAGATYSDKKNVRNYVRCVRDL